MFSLPSCTASATRLAHVSSSSLSDIVAGTRSGQMVCPIWGVQSIT